MDPKNQTTDTTDTTLGIFAPELHDIAYELGEHALDLLNGLTVDQDDNASK